MKKVKKKKYQDLM